MQSACSSVRQGSACPHLLPTGHSPLVGIVQDEDASERLLALRGRERLVVDVDEGIPAGVVRGEHRDIEDLRRRAVVPRHADDVAAAQHKDLLARKLGDLVPQRSVREDDLLIVDGDPKRFRQLVRLLCLQFAPAIRQHDVRDPRRLQPPQRVYRMRQRLQAAQQDAINVERDADARDRCAARLADCGSRCAACAQNGSTRHAVETQHASRRRCAAMR